MFQNNGLNRGDLNMKVVIGIGVIHLLALGAPWCFTWSGFAWFMFLYWLSGWIGITLCYHRLLTHSSFKTPLWFEHILTTIGTISLQGGPIDWVGLHRIHHAYSDKPGDPHSPHVNDFSWAHVLWVFFRRAEGVDPRSVTLDLQKDPFMETIDRFHWVPPLTVGIVLFGTGFIVGGLYTALSWLVWGVGVRTVAVYHTTWFVNSAAHTWGYRSYNTSDGSRNNWWVGLLGGGEGWHNNHHADQTAAAHGWRWWEIDPTYWTIRLLGLVGLAWKIKKPNSAALLSKKVV